MVYYSQLVMYLSTIVVVLRIDKGNTVQIRQDADDKAEYNGYLSASVLNSVISQMFSFHRCFLR